MVDTGDLKSPGHCDRAGSSPAPGTTIDLVATSPSGKAAACKAAIPSSNLGVASKIFYFKLYLILIRYNCVSLLSGDVRVVECAGLENR